VGVLVPSIIAEKKELPVELQKENKSSMNRGSYANSTLAQPIKPTLGWQIEKVGVIGN
jgi:hypothetical protein